MSLEMLTSHPSDIVWSQSAMPTRHAAPHAPDVHVAAVPGGTGQIAHVLPHDVGDVVDAQVFPHTPDLHVATPFVGFGTGQTVPHDPQFLTSLPVATSHPSDATLSQSVNPAVHE